MGLTRCARGSVGCAALAAASRGYASARTSAKAEAFGACAAAEAYGKINLTLDVFGRRSDGYHELRSLVVGVDLADRVCCRVRPAEAVTLSCSDPTLEGEDNLVLRAVRAWERCCGRERGLSIELTKNIPVGGGMGGGSSDAAATLGLCNHLFSAGLDRAALSALGASIGSDVPLFFYLPVAVVTGRGAVVEPVALKWSGWVLLAFAGAAVSTAHVYRAWRPSDAASMRRGSIEAILQATFADELSALLRNHLEPAVFRIAPVVARAYEALRRLGCDKIRVSGAGSVLYQLFDDKEAAQSMAKRIEGGVTGIKANVVAAPVGIEASEGHNVETSKH